MGFQIPDCFKIQGLTPVNLVKAAETVYSIGLKLGFGIWLKIYKTDWERAANTANQLALELISNERFTLAIKLIEYALVRPKLIPDRLHRALVLNLAQAYKWNGDSHRAIKVLDAMDWSAIHDDLRIGEVLIRDDFAAACMLIPKLRLEPKWERDYFTAWPIFREFRKRQDFLDAYEAAYG